MRIALVSLLFTLGLTACVTEEDEAPPAPDPAAEPDAPAGADGVPIDVPVDPAGDALPGPGDDTCGGAPREKADGPCTP